MKIFHIIRSLDDAAVAARIGMLTRRQADIRHQICCIGVDGPWAAPLRTDGARVDCLRWTRTFDTTAWRTLRQLLPSADPDLVHVWGLPELRVLALAGGRWLAQTIVSNPLPHEPDGVGRLGRWLLRRVRQVTASSFAEAAACRALGIGSDRLAVVPPGVDAVPAAQAQRASAHTIVCVGNHDDVEGFRDAIWALDILRLVFNDARLTLIGARQCDRLHRFASETQTADRVQYLEWHDGVALHLAQAHVCWALGTGDRHALLRAMAASCPVVAADHPATREMVTDGATGYLTPSGDKAQLCKRTRALFRDALLARSIGDAARRHVMNHFNAAAFASLWAEQYARAAAALRTA
ncbi:MAG: glycosyltransferase family 4 protein [Gemmataceae bacterium]|nr:glycosyltransferase family 4 protein [Gemmataceae bacterium]